MEQMPEELLKKDASETPENASERAYDIAPLERINISFDRSSVQLKLVSKNGFSEYKDFIKNGRKLHSEILEVPPGTLTTDGYYMNVRGKETLKELICGREFFDLRKFNALLGSLCRLADLSLANRGNVDFANVVFDYNCIFVRDPYASYQFVYMPGSGKAVNRAGVTELVKVAFLNTDLSGLSVSQTEDLSRMIKGMHGENDLDILADELKNVCEYVSQIETGEGFGKKLLRVIGLTDRKKKDFSKTSPAPVTSAGTIVIKGKEELEDLSIEREMSAEENVVIRCGRDNEWGDVCIPNVFVSRKHLQLTFDREGVAEIVDMSSNGTTVNGERLEGKAFFDTAGDGIAVGLTPDCGFEVRFVRRTA